MKDEVMLEDVDAKAQATQGYSPARPRAEL